MTTDYKTMSEIDAWLLPKLENRKVENSFRQLGNIQHDLIDFTSNDYLGLAHASMLAHLIQQKFEQMRPALNGSTGSRLLSGSAAYTLDVENKLAGIFKGERALLFNSGYAANLAVLSALPQRGDTILYDELAHACMKDGARLSLANRFSFKHNDLVDLENKLKKATGHIFIAVESVYSMDGDHCPLNELLALANQYQAAVIIDEAHSTGIYGDYGSGWSVYLDVHEQLAVRVYTFGKGMGIHGACVVGSNVLIDYLINFARPFIYTTALPPHSVAAVECAFDFLRDHIYLQRQLKERIELYDRLTSTWKEQRIQSQSAIQTVLVPGNDHVKQVALKLQQKGFDVRPILSPTVPEGKERLRICLHTYNSFDQIEALAHSIQEIIH